MVDEAAGTITFTVTKTGATELASSVDFATVDGSAVAGSDYTANNGTLNFAAGETVKTITVAITNDSIFEGAQDFSVQLGNPSNATIGDGTQVATIVDDGRTLPPGGPVDDDRPTLNIGSDIVIDEAAGTVTFTVTKVGATEQAVTVDYATANGSATAGLDYTGQSGSLSFAAGETSKTLTIAIANDSEYEISENFSVSISNPTNAVLGTASATGTIVDDGRLLPGGPADDDRPGFSINDVLIDEAAGTVSFTVTRAGDLSQSATVDYAGQDGTATGADYSVAAGSLNFAAGVASQTITVAITNDGTFEGPETFNINLSNPVGAVIVDGQGVGTIVDDGRTLPPGTPANDDRPVFNMGADFVVDEAAGTITFTVTKTGATELASSVDFATVDGSAVAGSDYTANNGTLNFAAGETVKTITVAITNDSIFEGAQDFSVQLGNPSNATIGDGTQVATIVDDGRTLPPGGPVDDDRPTLNIGSDIVIDEAAGTVTFTVTKVGATEQAVTVDYATANGSATAGLDYTGQSGSLSFAAGETSKTLTIAIANDSEYEISENFSVSISNPTNAVLGTASATGTIVDDGRLLPGGPADDDRPGFSINDVLIDEAAGTVSFTVTRAGDLSQSATVDYAGQDGTATGADYSVAAGSLNFAAGVASQTITVAITNDGSFEGPETFNINLSNPVGAVIVDGQGVGTIVDDNVAPTAVSDNYTMAEDGGTITLNPLAGDSDSDGGTVTLTGINGTALTPGFAQSIAVSNGTVNVSATGVITFTPNPNFSGSVTFPYTISDGQGASATANQVITVTPVNDAPVVGNATISVSEEGLVGGLVDSTGNPSDSTNLTVQSGTLSVVDPDSAVSVSLLSPLTTLTAGGVAVTWSGSGTQTLVGSAGGVEVLRATIDNAGNYTVTLSKAIDHASGNGENIETVSLGVSVSDGVAAPVQGSLTVNIEDDAPNAIPGIQSVVLPAQDTNIMLILDTSGSMGSGAGSKLQIMKDSVTMMLDQYNNLGDVMVRVVTFNSSASAYGTTWITVDAAKSYVNSLGSGNNTNYDAALITAQSAFASSGKIAGATNVSYFLTDGAPTRASDWDGSGPLTSQNGIQPGEEALWQSFLTTNHINSFAYGMGTGASQANMDPVAYDGITGTDTQAIVVANVADLPPILRDSIVTPTSGDLISGSLGAGSGIGADGGYLDSFALNGTTYSSGGAFSGTNRGTYDAATNSWTVTTTAGGKFVVDMDTTAYTYTPPASTSAAYAEGIGYTLRDNDGDLASSTLTINVAPPQLHTLVSTTSALTGTNLGLAGEYFGYNDNRDGTATDTLYQGTTAVRLHSDDGSADAGVANNVDRLADVEAIIEGRNGNTELINNAVLSAPEAADATFSANKLEFGLPAGSNTPLFSNDLGQNGKVTSGAIGASAGGNTNNLYTFLKVGSGNVDTLVATSGLGDTTDAIIRMVGYINIPEGGTYDLRITADDGYRVLIGGQNVAQLDYIQSTATNVYTGQVLGEGLQSIEILYWDQAGHASLRIEVKATGAADTAYKIIGNDEFALFSPTDVPTLGANQDIVETSTNGVWAVRTGEDFTGSDVAEKIVGSDGKDTIHAGAGNDVVQGGGGSDIIYGGAGDDRLIGGAGSDTFAWTLADAGTAARPATDTIADFNSAAKIAGGDVLDLRDLIADSATTPATLDAYLHFTHTGNDTVIDVKPDGAAGQVTQTIVLSGVDLTANGTLNDQTIIQDLLTKGKLITD